MPHERVGLMHRARVAHLIVGTQSAVSHETFRQVIADALGIEPTAHRGR
jgi:hypothetical protein